MNTIVLTYRAIGRRITTVSLPSVNWKVIYLLGLPVLLSMLILYVFLINDLTRGAYLIKNYDKDIKILLTENKTLEANFAGTGLLERVSQRAKELSFEKTANIKYIQIIDSSLAKVQ